MAVKKSSLKPKPKATGMSPRGQTDPTRRPKPKPLSKAADIVGQHDTIFRLEKKRKPVPKRYANTTSVDDDFYTKQSKPKPKSNPRAR